MWKQISSLSILTVLFRASTALAHPGHGAEGQSYDLWHYLVEPTHAIVVFGLVLLLWVAHRRLVQIHAKQDVAVINAAAHHERRGVLNMVVPPVIAPDSP